jgi:hypothetical protein
MSKFTSLLFARPSFKSGLARAMDIGGVYSSYNSSESPEAADSVAIASDWYAVGADLLLVTRRCVRELPVEARNGRIASVR